MAFTEIFNFTDEGRTVVYERDDTDDGGAGTTGRHRITEDGTPYTAAPAGRPARSPNYIALSKDAAKLVGYGTPVNEPAIYRITEVTPS